MYLSSAVMSMRLTLGMPGLSISLTLRITAFSPSQPRTFIAIPFCLSIFGILCKGVGKEMSVKLKTLDVQQLGNAPPSKPT